MPTTVARVTAALSQGTLLGQGRAQGCVEAEEEETDEAEDETNYYTFTLPQITEDDPEDEP